MLPALLPPCTTVSVQVLPLPLVLPTLPLAPTVRSKPSVPKLTPMLAELPLFLPLSVSTFWAACRLMLLSAVRLTLLAALMVLPMTLMSLCWPAPVAVMLMLPPALRLLLAAVVLVWLLKIRQSFYGVIHWDSFISFFIAFWFVVIIFNFKFAIRVKREG